MLAQPWVGQIFLLWTRDFGTHRFLKENQQARIAKLNDAIRTALSAIALCGAGSAPSRGELAWRFAGHIVKGDLYHFGDMGPDFGKLGMVFIGRRLNNNTKQKSIGHGDGLNAAVIEFQGFDDFALDHEISGLRR